MNVFLKIIIGFLLFFTPFAFAGAEPWGFSVLQGGVVLCWVLFLFSHKRLIFSSVFKPVFFTLAFLIVLTLVQLCFSQTLLDPVPWHPITLMPLYAWEHISLFATYLAVAALIPQLYKSQENVQNLLFWVILSSVAVALCFVCLPKGEYIYRLAGLRAGVGPFLNRNHASIFFVLGAIVTLGVFFNSQLQAGKIVSRHQKTSFYMKQVCLFVVFGGLVAAAVMTRSRGGMLSLLMGIFCYAFLCVWAIPHQLRKRLKGFFLTLILLLLSAGWIYTHVEDINAFAQRGTGASEQTRKMMYRSANQILKQYPLWGIGVGAMPVVITSYVEWPVNKYIERLHNDWLEILLGVGYIGAMPILAGVLWFMFLALKRLKRLEVRKQFLFAALLSALVAMCIGSTVDFHFFIPANAYVFFLLLGCVCAATYAKHHVHEIELKVWLKLLILLVLCASVYVPTQKTRAWRCVVFGRGLKTQAKLAQYEQSVLYYPSPRYAVRLGNAYFNASLRAEAPEEKEALRQSAFDLSTTYLQRYPRDKALSYLYLRARP